LHTVKKDDLLKRYRLKPCLPKHVAIIMDGNGRWARKRHLPRIAGHRAGAHSIRELVRLAGELGIEALTLYAFSTENWKRPLQEIHLLMRLLKQYLKSEVKELLRNNVRLQTIGNRQDLPPEIQKELKKAVQATAHCTGLTLVLALSYSGRADITGAVKRIVGQVKKGQIKPESITEKIITNALSTSHLPEVDLLIRTSGEMRISNFLLWELAYSEIYITQTLWPDFKTKDFIAALKDFQGRQRRFGGVTNIIGSFTSWVR
jgi:undecaprenyl diphosphate synthase